ncbi:MAG TPA: hypothetical protein VJV75_03780 [Candidatus Polarisedimenticolia bacterium]|nr:hypothetical protein [Candidatus Polarisedimenticolia bacterium]
MACNAAKPRRLRITIPLLSIIASDGSLQASAKPKFWVKCPSARLAFSLRLVINSPNGIIVFGNYDDGGGATASTWQIYAHAGPDDKGKIARPFQLSPVFVDDTGAAAARAIPDVWEYQGPTELFRVDPLLGIFYVVGSGGFAGGTVFADCTFEAVDEIEDDHLTELFRLCEVRKDTPAISNVRTYAS